MADFDDEQPVVVSNAVEESRQTLYTIYPNTPANMKNRQSKASRHGVTLPKLFVTQDHPELSSPVASPVTSGRVV